VVAVEALRGIAGRRIGREGAAAPELAAVVGEHVARDGVQPRQRVLDTPRELAPRHGERLRGQILDVVTRDAPREVRADRRVVRLVDRAELLLVAHTRHLSRATQDLHSDAMRITRDAAGGAYIRLAEGEVRDSVQLDELEDAGRLAALESLVLHFDFYGRLIGLEVTSSADSALPPSLLDQAQ
jgi:hypothetical protein